MNEFRLKNFFPAELHSDWQAPVASPYMQRTISQGSLANAGAEMPAARHRNVAATRRRFMEIHP